MREGWLEFTPKNSAHFIDHRHADAPLVAAMRSLGRLLTRPEVRQPRRLLAVQHRWATGGSSSQHSRIGREVTALDVLKNSRQGAVQFVHESESVRLPQQPAT